MYRRIKYNDNARLSDRKLNEKHFCLNNPVKNLIFLEVVKGLLFEC